ncbi:MAG: hypothetical protein GXC73_01535 [Chitinophagaceae bacterium]|nr:hypothetical protein [Chitinophagaceae bacterium]
MLKKYSRQIQVYVAALLLLSTACNKVYEPVASNNPALDTVNTIGKRIEANASFSIFTAALKRTGMYAYLNVPSNSFTVYAPSDAALTTAGLSLAVVNAMPLQDLTAVIRYHILQNEKLMSANIAAATVAAPNVIRISSLPIGTLPAPAPANFPIWMPLFPSKNAVTNTINNIPIAAADAITGTNGVVHSPATVIMPPKSVLWDTISNDPDLAYFKAAIQRGDQAAASSAETFQYALSQPVINLTVFAPNNAAFQALVYGLVYQQVFAASSGNAVLADQQATAAVNAGPAFLSSAAVTPAMAQGIVAYHLLTLNKRVYSVNFPQTAANYQTFVNRSIAAHPGLTISSTLASGFGAALSVKGVGNPSAAAAIAGSPLGVDRIAVNGVFYKINQVLLPQ